MLYFFNRKLGLLLFIDSLYLNKTLLFTFSNSYRGMNTINNTHISCVEIAVLKF